MHFHHFRAVLGAVCVAGLPMAALAGPPLSIDDPGILDPGKFEIIVAATAETRDSGDSYFLPIIDVSYGVSQDVQVSAVLTRAVTNPADDETKSDVGPAALGIKWRFLDRDALQMSVAPFWETLPRQGAADRGVSDDVDALVVPVEFQYQFASWRLNAEVAYATVHDDADEWIYGVAAAYPLTDRVEALVELHGGADRTFDDNGTLYRVGMDLTLSERFHLLASLGSSFDEPGSDDLDVQAYLGLQWFP